MPVRGSDHRHSRGDHGAWLCADVVVGVYIGAGHRGACAAPDGLGRQVFISGVIGVLLARALGQSWRLSRAQWRATVVFGISQNAIYLGLNFVAMQWIEASLAAIIASTMPLLVALALWAFMGARLRLSGIAGLIAGALGVVIIMGARIKAGVDLLGAALCGVGAIALAVATLMVRGASSGGNYLMIVGMQMLIGAVPLTIIALASEPFVVTWTWSLALAFAYTVIVPGLLATLVWFRLVNRIGATGAAAYHFLTPFFGVAVAAVLLGETLGARDILGVAIIMAGLFAVQRARATIA